jgi:ribonuclease BN (tRNA processing enzyme)
MPLKWVQLTTPVRGKTMSLQLQMLGTGSAFSKKYGNNNALITQHGFTLLIDCGFTTPAAMQHLNKKLTDIDAIVITHLHADHVVGLEEFAFTMRYQYGRKTKLYLPISLVKPIWDDCLKGGLGYTTEGFETLEGFFEVIPLEINQSIEIAPGFCIEVFPTPHIPNMPSFSIIINSNLYYSADTCFNRPFLDYVNNDWAYEEKEYKANIIPIMATKTKVHPSEWDLQEFLRNEVIFIDDSQNCARLKNAVISEGKMIDWAKIEFELKQFGVI